MLNQSELIDWIENSAASSASDEDIIAKYPGFSDDDAYRLQFALMARRVAGGDRVIGYKAAHTSLAIQQEQKNGLTIGTLLASCARSQQEPINLPSYSEPFAEPEIAVLFKHDLQGPNLSLSDVVGAVEGVLPALEIVSPASGARRKSKQMNISRSKLEGGYVIGSQIRSIDDIDLRLEGVIISRNGVPQRSATGVEAMGGAPERCCRCGKPSRQIRNVIEGGNDTIDWLSYK